MPLVRSYVLVCAASCLASVAGAQGRSAAAQQQPVPRWEIPGLDITPNGGWRVRARAVAAARARFLVQRNFAMLNAAPAGPAPDISRMTPRERFDRLFNRTQDFGLTYPKTAVPVVSMGAMSRSERIWACF